MLREVRSGLRVVGVFYGHPGNFVSPTRRALAIARDEGYVAKMLPGISADDCLFADLLIDPCYPGLQTVEATDVLVRNRPLQTSSHVVIYQVGVICKSGFDFHSIEVSAMQSTISPLLTQHRTTNSTTSSPACRRTTAPTTPS